MSGDGLRAAGVSKVYGDGKQRRVQAVRDVSVELADRSLGVAGESGSGKSTLMRLLLGLEPPTAGTVTFDGRPVPGTGDEQRTFRSSVQAVFQDPASSLNSRHPIWRIISEPVWAVHGASRDERRTLAADLLPKVGLPAVVLDRRTNQLSGGERQRVAIARALSLDPRYILLDEPVTSLDVSRRGGILNLLNELAAERGMRFLVISHDLSALVSLCDQLCVMREGRIIEAGETAAVVADPEHPYTQQLVRAASDPMAAEAT